MARGHRRLLLPACCGLRANLMARPFQLRPRPRPPNLRSLRHSRRSLLLFRSNFLLARPPQMKEQLCKLRQSRWALSALVRTQLPGRLADLLRRKAALTCRSCFEKHAHSKSRSARRHFSSAEIRNRRSEPLRRIPAPPRHYPNHHARQHHSNQKHPKARIPSAMKTTKPKQTQCGQSCRHRRHSPFLA